MIFMRNVLARQHDGRYGVVVNRQLILLIVGEVISRNMHKMASCKFGNATKINKNATNIQDMNMSSCILCL